MDWKEEPCDAFPLILVRTILLHVLLVFPYTSGYHPLSNISLLIKLTLPCPSLDSVSSASNSASSSVNFTFVNQAEDIVSLSHRKISDANQRHAIRSHVMQRVRQEELAQGKKRPTGRDHPKRPSRIAIRSRSSDSDSSGASDLSSSRSQSITFTTPLPSTSAAFEDRKATFSPPRHPSQQLQLFIAPAIHEFDPFDTLPTHGLQHKSIESLLQYCKSLYFSNFSASNHRFRFRYFTSHDLFD